MLCIKLVCNHFVDKDVNIWIGPSCFFTMYAGIRPLCTSIWYNGLLDDASVLLHLPSVFIEILHF